MQLKSYACCPENGKGRLFDEPPSSTRNPYQRDRDRIIHSAAFRRLKYKTQVFVYHEGDHYRTRLTHTIEVANIARALARSLGVHEDLAETIALAHDLGHPPFAHAGEDALKLCLEQFGGFDHNAQSLRIVTSLERRYAAFDGLNLTWETLEGLAKHNGPLLPDEDGRYPFAIEEIQEEMDLRLDTYAPLEAQIAAISDDIAYNSHDLEDGIRHGFFTLDDLSGIPILSEIVMDVNNRYPMIDASRKRHEVVRRLVNQMTDDVLRQTQYHLEEVKPKTPDDIRNAGAQLVDFSPEMNEAITALRRYLFDNMYRHYTVNRTMSKAKRIVTDLFNVFYKEPDTLPTQWQQTFHDKCMIFPVQRTKRKKLAKKVDIVQEHDICKARVVLDYVAGMTDRYAIEEHQRMFDNYSK